MRRWKPLATGAALLTVALVVQPSPANANPWSILGFDGPSIGVANALAGGAKGAAAVVYNPAGLIKERVRDVSVAYLHTESLLRFDPEPNPEILDLSSFGTLTTDQIAGCPTNPTCVQEVARYNNYVERARLTAAQYREVLEQMRRRAVETRSLDGVSIGLAIPLALDPSEAVAALGAAAFVPIGPIVYQRIKGPNSPYFLQYDDAPHRIVIDVALAAEPFSGFRVGVGVDVLVDIVASPQLSAVLPPELTLGIPPDPNFQDVFLYVDGDVEVPPAFSPTAGIQYSPVPWLDLGISFRDEQGTVLDIPSQLVVYSPFGTRRIDATVAAGGAYNPRQVAGGFAVRPLEFLEIYGEVAWRQWSTYEPPFSIEARIQNVGDAACDVIRTFQDLDRILNAVSDVVTLSTEDVCNLVGGFNDIQVQTYDGSNNQFTDIVSPAIGIRYRSASLDVAAGYRYEPTPVPEQTGLYTILDSDTHILSLAADYTVRKGIRIGLFGQYKLLATRSVTKDRVRLLDQNGNADAFPDVSFSTQDGNLQGLAAAVEGRQVVSPGYPGYTVGGGYLTAGLQIGLSF